MRDIVTRAARHLHLRIVGRGCIVTGPAECRGIVSLHCGGINSALQWHFMPLIERNVMTPIFLPAESVMKTRRVWKRQEASAVKHRRNGLAAAAASCLSL